MRVCLPTIDESGLEARLSPHFGSAPYFTVVDASTGKAMVLPNGQARHEHGRCDPVGGLDGQGIDVVICRGLGRRALARLAERGIAVMATEAWLVADAVRELGRGGLTPVTLDEACAGHGHGHGHD